MKAVEKLALKGPLELRMVEVAWMQFKIVGMDRDIRVFELNDDFDAFAFFASAKIQQWMFV